MAWNGMKWHVVLCKCMRCTNRSWNAMVCDGMSGGKKGAFANSDRNFRGGLCWNPGCIGNERPLRGPVKSESHVCMHTYRALVSGTLASYPSHSFGVSCRRIIFYNNNKTCSSNHCTIDNTICIFWHSFSYTYVLAFPPSDELRHCRNCSNRTFCVDLHRGAQKIFRQELPLSIPEEAEDLQNLNARTEEDVNRISAKSSHKDLYQIMKGH